MENDSCTRHSHFRECCFEENHKNDGDIATPQKYTIELRNFTKSNWLTFFRLNFLCSHTEKQRPVHYLVKLMYIAIEGDYVTVCVHVL